MAKRKPKDLVDFANSQSPAAFVEQFVTKTRPELQYRARPDLLLDVDIVRSDKLSQRNFDSCFDLVKETSAAAYQRSTRGWKPAEKKDEMREPDMWYLLVRQQQGPQPVGFASFMITIEDDYPVVYIYEIHLSDALRGAGIGAYLMSVVEAIGWNAGMEKAMLTVFTSNEGAERFYRRSGYETDEYSPQPRMLRGGKVKRPDYVILSKGLQ